MVMGHVVFIVIYKQKLLIQLEIKSVYVIHCHLRQVCVKSR